ncbi:MAG: hypothetical protein KAY32_07880 [Candidatus Eisenbacteria sp.]|nr:hypothetical protein [Candidatus Eisenbacteria bacterium]
MAQRAEHPVVAAGRLPVTGAARIPVAVGAAGAVLILMITLLLLQSLGLTEGRLTYALDDPYIHMAMAKNVAQHGVWGVTSYEFTSSTSSPLWTLLLGGGFVVAGVEPTIPLILNVLAAGLVIVVVGCMLDAGRPGRRGLAAIVLIVLVLCVPLAPLVMTGQEHVLHLLLVLLFAYLAARLLDGRQPLGPRARAAFWILPPLLTLVRYESLFVILPVIMLLAARRRWGQGVLLGFLALAPLVAYGLFSMQQGWALIPNPILSKANLPHGDPGQMLKSLSGYLALRRLFVNPHLLLPVIAALVWLVRAPRRDAGEGSLARPLLTIFLVATFLHVTFADVGWFYRYEAYLVGLALVGLGIALFELQAAAGGGRRGESHVRWRRPAAILLGILFVVAVGDRGVRAALATPRATANIYEQQVQMGHFLARYYPAAPVAINDIGAANFLADIRCLDLFGLANREVLAHIRAGTYGVETVDRLARAHGARVAILHPNWLRTPASWERVGSWTIEKNIVNGGDTIAFYALDRLAARSLAEHLRAFAPQLPRTVVQRGTYVEIG